MVNLTGEIVLINRNRSAGFGYSRAELDRPVEMLLPKLVRASTRDAGGEVYLSFRCRIVDARGGAIFFGLKKVTNLGQGYASTRPPVQGRL